VAGVQVAAPQGRIEGVMKILGYNAAP